MPSVTVSDKLKALMRQHKDRIKSDYVTEKLFVDSAVREKMRRMGIASVGDDEIISHLDRIYKNRFRRRDKQRIASSRYRHKKRLDRQKGKFIETNTETKTTVQ